MGRSIIPWIVRLLFLFYPTRNTDRATMGACLIAWGLSALIHGFRFSKWALQRHGAVLLPSSSEDRAHCLEQFNRWLESSKEFAEKSRIDLLDLCYWG